MEGFLAVHLGHCPTYLALARALLAVTLGSSADGLSTSEVQRKGVGENR